MGSIIRFCTEARESGQNSPPEPLSAYEDSPAYVLLGNPGAGKTTVFEQEAERTGACFVTARDLITFDVAHKPEWRGKTLFIDGLDEIRARSPDVRTPLDRIRAQLDKLEKPRFRLSCREADWFGASDRDRLKAVLPESDPPITEITVLHLEPLTDNDVIGILSAKLDEANARTFVDEARKRGLEELLKNPQTLDMLAKIVIDGNWPDSRTETFEMACRKMLGEHNREHEIAVKGTPINESRLLDAAGFLCAVQLVAGNVGYALTPETKDANFPCIDDLDYDDHSLLRRVTQRNLFKASGEERVEPAHRHIAEYLAAGYLADQIDTTGLPVGRVLSLITGEDGVVVSELRGLSAWLAAQCISERRAVIDRDPLGVVLYGDVKAFAERDKRRLLDGLREEGTKNPWFRSSDWASSPFGALATPDMEGAFEKILTTPGRDGSDQTLAQCVLDAMTHGDRLPALDDILIHIVRDETWWPLIRRAALEVLLNGLETESDLAARMKSILEEIRGGKVADTSDDLAGHLLSALYPDTVKAEEVFDHLHAPTNLNYSGWYGWFWSNTLLKKSSEEDIYKLLDQLASRTDDERSSLYDRMRTGLLTRGLEVHGESIDAARLYQWLGVGLDRDGYCWRVREYPINPIQNWLSMHPEIQKSIICVGERHCRGSEDEDFGTCFRHMKDRLYQARPPADYGLWCLQRMSSLPDDELARNMLLEAVDSIINECGNEGLSLERIEETVAGNEKHKTWLNEYLFRSLDEEHWRRQERKRHNTDRRNQEKNEWVDHVISQESALQEGTAHPRLLHYLAAVYFNRFPDLDRDTQVKQLRNFTDLDRDTQVKQLRNFLGGNEGLVESVLEGFRCSMDRNDVPAVDEIIQLDVQNQLHPLSYPSLAGLAENSQRSPDYILQLSDSTIERMIAFYMTGIRENAPWYSSLLESRPELVSRILIKYVAAVLHGKKQHVANLHGILNSLVYESEYVPVARSATLEMLKGFPARCTNQQLELLDPLLKSSLRHLEHLDREALLARIEAKLGLRSMNSAQCVYWLATGFMADPAQYQEKFTGFIQGNESRTRHLARFLWDQHEQWSFLDNLPVSTIALLIRILGRYFAPYSRMVGAVSPAMYAADFLQGLIGRLGSNAEKEATDALDSLLKDTNLVKWRDSLQRARFEQLAARREAGFRHPKIGQVVSTLKNEVPANAGDLAALVLDTLQDMAKRIRNSSTDDYKQYWNLENLRPVRPRHEDACRDTLLSDLQRLLAPFGVDAQPEGQYADDRRSDIRVSVGGDNGFAIPIEIKKNSHRNLWRAVHDQLVARYTRDPLADGFGVYLVFWFGPDTTSPPPEGRRPHNADELAQRLRATLSADESRKISICVVNVELSRP